MILSFKPQFVPLIVNGNKIHTIREDASGRWREGMGIHFATGVRTPAFNHFRSGSCISIQHISMRWGMVKGKRTLRIFIRDTREGAAPWEMDLEQKEQLARNDGFTSFANFCRWPGWNDKNFSGIIIHWTRFKYFERLPKPVFSQPSESNGHV